MCVAVSDRDVHPWVRQYQTDVCIRVCGSTRQRCVSVCGGQYQTEEGCIRRCGSTRQKCVSMCVVVPDRGVYCIHGCGSTRQRCVLYPWVWQYQTEVCTVSVGVAVPNRGVRVVVQERGVHA